MTPIAAYLSAIRSVVVSPFQTVRCTVVDAHEALVSIDGREDRPLAVGDVVEVRAVTRPIRLAAAARHATVLGPVAAQGRPPAAMNVHSLDRTDRPVDAQRDVSLAAGRLVELSVTDLALIDRLRLSFEPGLNVLTGETGAGKSLLIDALGLAIGARADTNLVRHGAEAARVEALFDRLPEPLIAVREIAAGWPLDRRVSTTRA